MSRTVAEQAAEDLVVVDTLGSEATSEINEDLEASGQEPLSDDAYAVGINNSGDVVAIEDDGTEVTLESASAIDEEVQAAEDLAATAEAETDEASTESGVSTQDKGFLTAAASSIAGCLGGVVGFDAVLSILENRVSYWALTKFLGSKVGPGIAISCIAGAGGALATYMNW